MFDTLITMTFLNFLKAIILREKNQQTRIFLNKNNPACKELWELTVDSHLDIWNYFMA